MLLLCASLVTGQVLYAQYAVKGTVYDSTGLVPLEAVTVLSTSGRGTLTDKEGHYVIAVNEQDSIWFSYLNKATVKYAVLKMYDPLRFNIALQSTIPVLPEVKIRQRNYRMDSLQNRLDYAKVFNYERPNLESMTSIGPSGAGIDLNELVRVFQFRKNRNMVKFRERLLEQERDKFIDNRFSKALVLRLTGLTGAERDSFMTRYRPNYEFTLMASDYEFQQYIKDAYRHFRITHASSDRKSSGSDESQR